MKIHRAPPPTFELLRERLYRGDAFLLPPTGASEALVTAVRERVREELGGENIREIPLSLEDDDLFRRFGRIRKILYTEPRFLELARDTIAQGGFDPALAAFDPLRLRVIAHRGFENPRARPVYYPHRDTWYSHPQSIVTWWIPLDDLEEHETFVFHPRYFGEAVDNDSEIFDYREWVARGWDLKIGWQDPEAGRTARYPRAHEGFDPGPGLGFSCRRGENLLFSGSHFHQTRPQATGKTRYSLDFRVVHLPDEAMGLGAPNVDNRSRGSALPDYTQPRVRLAQAEEQGRVLR